MACGCSGRTCSCALQGGTNVTVTGSGSSADPYIINSVESTPGSVVVTTTIDGLNTLATAGSLVVGNRYVVTDWTASPNLSGPNLLLLDALDTHTPSGFVQVQTPLGDIGPCDGEFIWNLSGVLNIMSRLRDTLGNDVNTIGGATIGEFPWGNTSVLNNIVREGSFAGIPSGTFGIANCHLDSVAINLAGGVSASMTAAKIRGGSITVTSGGVLIILDSTLDDVTLSSTGATANLNVNDSTVQTGTLAQTAGIGTINGCRLSGATVNGSSAAAGAWTIANTTMNQGTVTISGGGAGSTLLQGVEITGQGGYVLTINVGSAVTPSPQITNTQFVGRSAGSAGLTLQGSSTYTIDRTTIYGSSSICVLDGTSGTVSFNNDQLFLSSATSRASGATGNFSISASTILGNASALTQPATAGSFSISDSVIRDSTITQGGSGSLSVAECRVFDAATISTAAGSVRALTVQNTQLSAGATLAYTRTAAATAGAADTVQNSVLNNSTLTWAGATDPATSQVMTDLEIVQNSVLTATNPAGATPASSLVINGASTLNLNAGGTIAKSRFHGGAVITTGALSHTQVVVDGPYTETFTVALTNYRINLGALTQFKQKASTQTVTASTTPVNDADLVFTLLPNISYRVSMALSPTSTAATGGTGGLRTLWAVTGTVTTTNRLCTGPGINTTDATATAAAATTVGITRASKHGTGTAVTYGVLSSATSAVAEDFVASGGASGGTLTLQWAQNTASGTTSLEGTNSYATMTQVS
jgi:hypothetical protein